MRLFLSPISAPATWISLALITVFCSLGRVGLFSEPLWSEEGRTLGFSGTTCTMITAFALIILVGTHAKHFPALEQLGGDFRRWLAAGLRFITLSALLLALAATMTDTILYTQSEGYYAPFDLFLITSFSTTAANVCATFLLHCLAFFASATTGLTFASPALIKGEASSAIGFVLTCALVGGFIGFFDNAIGILIGCAIALIYSTWMLIRLPRML